MKSPDRAAEEEAKNGSANVAVRLAKWCSDDYSTYIQPALVKTLVILMACHTNEDVSCRTGTVHLQSHAETFSQFFQHGPTLQVSVLGRDHTDDVIPKE
jgi:hypothetical protein